MPWVVVRTKVQRERYALENAHRQGITCYLPQVEAKRGRRPQYMMLQPLFPSYMFADVTDDQWRRLLSTYGVATIIFNGQRPAYISARIIEQMKAREHNGIVVLPELRKGDRVRVTSGPMANQMGIHQGTGPQQRIAILLDVLGGKRKVLIDAAAVVPA